MSSRVFPSSDGFSVTCIPALFMAFIFSSAVPFPPEMIAHACPILFPGGAVLPAINPIIGFDT